MIYKSNTNLIIKQIEEQKSGRSKNIYFFTLSLTLEEEKMFNKELKKLINSLSKTNKEQI